MNMPEGAPLGAKVDGCMVRPLGGSASMSNGTMANPCLSKEMRICPTLSKALINYHERVDRFR